jgi:antitoxin component of MazEF toxin-antitoxin module
MSRDFKPKRSRTIAGADGAADETIESIDMVGTKRKRRRYELVQLMGEITEANRLGEISWGPSFGKEVW